MRNCGDIKIEREEIEGGKKWGWGAHRCSKTQSHTYFDIIAWVALRSRSKPPPALACAPSVPDMVAVVARYAGVAGGRGGEEPGGEGREGRICRRRWYRSRAEEGLEQAEKGVGAACGSGIVRSVAGTREMATFPGWWKREKWMMGGRGKRLGDVLRRGGGIGCGTEGYGE
jgi:hypothetical protein